MACDQKTIIGWIVWDTRINAPYRANDGRGYRLTKSPPKIYPTRNRAAAYTPPGMTQKAVMIDG